MKKMPYKKSLSGKQLMAKKYDRFELPKDIEALIGEFTSGASILIWGPSGSGKSTMALRFAKAFFPHGKCYYNTVEQKGRRSFQMAVEREELHELPASVIGWGVGDTWEEMCAKIKNNNAKFIFLDSIQYMQFDQFQFKQLAEKYPKRCFIIVSHGGAEPKGDAAQSIRYDVDVKIRIKDGTAYADSRLGGNKPLKLFSKTASLGPLFDS